MNKVTVITKNTEVITLKTGPRGPQGIQGPKGDQGDVNLTQLNTKVDKLMATNLVTNGDFSNGTTGWSGVGASVSNVGGRLQITPTAQWGGARQEFSLLANNRYYLKTQIDAPLSHYMIMFGISPSTVFNNVAGVSNLGIVFTAPTTGSVTLNIGTTLASNFVPFFADFVVLINLTQLFGAGNEPTRAQMDYLLSNFPNSWFNGTVELMNYKQLLDYVIDLDNAKANKIDPTPWIVPTLLNGTLPKTNDPIMYRLNEQGEIEFRGGFTNTSALFVAVFVIVAGLRPNTLLKFSIPASVTEQGIVYIQSGGEVVIGAGNATTGIFDMHNIKYRNN